MQQIGRGVALQAPPREEGSSPNCPATTGNSKFPTRPPVVEERTVNPWVDRARTSGRNRTYNLMIKSHLLRTSRAAARVRTARPPAVGIEPTTARLRIECSPDPESGESVFVREVKTGPRNRLEPLTSRLETMRAVHQTPGGLAVDVPLSGGAPRIRTTSARALANRTPWRARAFADALASSRRNASSRCSHP